MQVLLGVMPEAGADLRPPQHGLHPPQPPLQPPLHHRLLRHRPQHQHRKPQVMKVAQYEETVNFCEIYRENVVDPFFTQVRE